MAVEAYFRGKTVWTSEIDKYASIVIKERWKLPNLGDMKLVDWSNVEPVDILTVGYPCQPFSTAGKRKGSTDERHLWPYIKEIISQLQPPRVILENVRGHLTLGFKEVLADLTQIGYDAKWAIVRASDVGAPHRRERLFCVAQPTNANGFRFNVGKCEQERHQGQSQFESAQCCETTSHSHGDEQPRNRETQELGSRFDTRDQMRLRRAPNPLELGKLNPKFVEYMMGLPVGWVTDLEISRSQQLKLLGNGVVPQQAYLALQLLVEQ